MKDTKDEGTGDMFGIKRGRGRPKTGSAKTGAERQAAYRAKQQDNNVTVTINLALVEGLDGVTSENGKNRTVSRWHGLASRKRSFLRGFNENQIRASAGMACCFLENHSRIARLKQPSFENHENAVSRGVGLAQSLAVVGARIP